MRMTTKQAAKKVEDILRSSTGYEPAKVLAEKIHSPVSTVYRLIRILRLNGVAVYSRSRHGYVLAEYASKQDDTNFLRRANGAVSNWRIQAGQAEQHIRKRWKGHRMMPEVEQAMRPLLISERQLGLSMKAIIKSENSLGI